MMCQACENNEHYLCGMQTWCECECDGTPNWGDYSEDNEDTHTETCTCETCLQNHPERDMAKAITLIGAKNENRNLLLPV